MFKLHFWLWVTCTVVSQTSYGVTMKDVRRFDKGQLSFSLVDNEGGQTTCTHTLLAQVPWWQVVCEDRTYTVDVWVQSLSTPRGTRLTLMFDVSEGLRSSGEKLVQFRSHFTNLVVRDITELKSVASSLDVRNGQASLEVTAQL